MAAGGTGAQALVVAFAIACICAMPAAAAPFPWIPAQFEYHAQDEAMADLLQDLFVTQRCALELSEGVMALAPVSGQFRQSPRAVYEDLARAYGLQHYYDGNTMFLSVLAENRTVVKALGSVTPAQLRGAAAEAGYLDARYGFSTTAASNVVRLSGPPAYLKRMLDLLAALDTGAMQRMSSAASQLKAFRLMHASAEDLTFDVGGRPAVVRGVVSVLRDLLSATDSPAAPIRIATPGESTEGSVRTRMPRSPLAALLGGREDLAGSDPPLPGRDAGPPSVIASRGVSVSGDSRTNTVMVMAPASMMEMITKVIRDLDVAPQLVQIEATIVDLRDDALRETGIEWGLQSRRGNVAVNTREAIAASAGDIAAALGSSGNISILAGSGAVRFLSGIRALQATGAARVLSQPRLVTMDGLEAALSDQNVFYTRVSGARAANLYQVDVGLQLRVTPRVTTTVGGNREIRLQVFIEDGALAEERIDGLPVTNRSALNTQAVVMNGESLLIGGFSRTAEGRRDSRVPGLGSAPLVGGLFRNRERSAQHTERLILITPRLIDARGLRPAHAGRAGSSTVAVEPGLPAAYADAAGRTGARTEPATDRSVKAAPAAPRRRAVAPVVAPPSPAAHRPLPRHMQRSVLGSRDGEQVSEGRDASRDGEGQGVETLPAAGTGRRDLHPSAPLEAQQPSRRMPRHLRRGDRATDPAAAAEREMSGGAR